MISTHWQGVTALAERKPKRGWRIFLIVLAVLVSLAGVLLYHFRAEWKALRLSQKYSAEELETQLQENAQTVTDAVDASPDATVREPTSEEREALRDGALTQQELIDRLTQGDEKTAERADTEEQPAAPADANAAQSAQNPPKAERTDYQKQLSALVAEAYVLREEYLAALEALEDTARADYNGRTGSDRSTSSLAAMVSDYLARATELEKECDGKMDDLVTRLEKLISEHNGDMSMADAVLNTYVNEKSLKKAWYLARLKEKGLV